MPTWSIAVSELMLSLPGSGCIRATRSIASRHVVRGERQRSRHRRHAVRAEVGPGFAPGASGIGASKTKNSTNSRNWGSEGTSPPRSYA